MSTFDDERCMQPFMDVWYEQRGLMVDRSGSCKKYDCLLTKGTSSFAVEEKFNFQGIDYPNLIVELSQALETGALGWFYHVACDRLIWVYCPTSRVDPPLVIYSIDWPRFKPYVIDLLNCSGWQRFNLVVEGYGITLNYPVAWKPLLSCGIARRFEYDLL
jgi:hypothetical protein